MVFAPENVLKVELVKWNGFFGGHMADTFTSFNVQNYRILNAYDWKICLYILGAICSSNCLFGLMFKPLPKSEDEETIGCENIGSGDSNTDSLLKPDPNKEQQDTHKETFREMMLLLRDWAFLMFAVSNFLTSLGYPIPYSFVPVSSTHHIKSYFASFLTAKAISNGRLLLQDNAIELGLTATQGAYLVSLIGISNTVARVILGALSQKMNRLFLYNTCLVICGITMGVSNYIQPVTAVMAGVNCQDMISVDNVTNMTVYDTWVCDPYYGQFIYVNSYGVTR